MFESLDFVSLFLTTPICLESEDPYRVKSVGLCCAVGIIKSLLIITKLLYSSKNIAVCVDMAMSCSISATLLSGGIKKYGITISDSPATLLNT